MKPRCLEEMENANNLGKRKFEVKKSLERIEFGKLISHERALKSNCDL